MPSYFYPVVAGLAGDLGNKTVLDVGCGQGSLLSRIQANRMVGFDMSEQLATIAPQLVLKASIVRANAQQNLPYFFDFRWTYRSRLCRIRLTSMERLGLVWLAYRLVMRWTPQI